MTALFCVVFVSYSARLRESFFKVPSHGWRYHDSNRPPIDPTLLETMEEAWGDRQFLFLIPASPKQHAQSLPCIKALHGMLRWVYGWMDADSCTLYNGR